MKNIPLLLGTILGTVLMIVAVGFFFSNQVSTPDAEQVLDPVVVAGEKRLSTGNLDATITIVEFSDFQCPACKAAAPVVKQVVAEFDGQVELVYRHFPLDSIHPNARLAASASEVAHTYGKFWEMHDVLFEKQEEWSVIDNQDELKEIFGEYAQQLQIDKTEFLTKIEDETYAQFVQNDSVAGTQIDVLATPTFYVNGSKTPAPQLKSVVQSLLENKDAS